MPVIAGVDEVGYGPWLGPLVVCSTAFRAAQPELELWEALRSAVAREPDGERLAVNDSKELYSPARGIGGLEPTVLSFLAMLPELPGTSFRALACRLSLERSLALCAPWYEGADFAIPQLEGDLGGRAVALWDALRRANAVALSCRAAWVEPEEFNRVVQSRKNKSDLLFERACALVKSILEAAPREDVSIALGKQGGRRMYLPGLVREFGSVWVKDETAATSIYEFRQGGRRVRLAFLRDGETRHFGIALASMVGKYLREGAMRLFNAFWQKAMPELRATSGYGVDGRRFFREIEPELARRRIAREAVLRSR